MARTKDKVLGAAGNAKPYVEHALHDEQLRENVRAAFTAAREVYDELAGRRGVTGLAQKVATDKEIQENLRTAIEELRHAANRIQGKGDEHKARNSMLLLTGIALGILFNPVTGPETRRWLKEKVFGGGSEEFGYQAPSGDGST